MCCSGNHLRLSFVASAAADGVESAVLRFANPGKQIPRPAVQLLDASSLDTERAMRCHNLYAAIATTTFPSPHNKPLARRPSACLPPPPSSVFAHRCTSAQLAPPAVELLRRSSGRRYSDSPRPVCADRRTP